MKKVVTMDIKVFYDGLDEHILEFDIIKVTILDHVCFVFFSQDFFAELDAYYRVQYDDEYRHQLLLEMLSCDDFEGGDAFDVLDLIKKYKSVTGKFFVFNFSPFDDENFKTQAQVDWGFFKKELPVFLTCCFDGISIKMEEDEKRYYFVPEDLYAFLIFIVRFKYDKEGSEKLKKDIEEAKEQFDKGKFVSWD
jgi:hypothetical protein